MEVLLLVARTLFNYANATFTLAMFVYFLRQSVKSKWASPTLTGLTALLASLALQTVAQSLLLTEYIWGVLPGDLGLWIAIAVIPVAGAALSSGFAYYVLRVKNHIRFY